MTHEVIALRTAAQQALEAWQTATYGHPSHHKATLLAMTALSTAVAQQAEPVQEPVDAHTTTLRNLLECCLSWEPDACVLGNVTARQAVAALRAALAQQENKTPITDDHGKALLPQYQVIEQSGNWLLLYDQMQVGEKVRHEFRIQKLRHDVALYPGITLTEAQKRFRERVEADHE